MTSSLAARAVMAALLVLFAVLLLTTLALGVAGGSAQTFSAAELQSTGTVK